MPPTFPHVEVKEEKQWANFHGTVGPLDIPLYLTPEALWAPSDLHENSLLPHGQALRAILEYCFAQRLRLRTIGARWSLSPILTPDRVLLDTANLNAVIPVAESALTDDYKKTRGTKGLVPLFVQAGTTVSSLNRRLAQVQLALQTSGASDAHRIAGAIATGTHGAALTVGAIHDTVLGMHILVAPDRAVFLQSASAPFCNDQLPQQLGAALGIPTVHLRDDQLFQAALVSLGALGLVHGVVLEAAPLYRLSRNLLPRRYADPQVWSLLQTCDTSALFPGVSGTPHHLQVFCHPYPPDSRPGLFAHAMWKVPAQGAAPAAAPVSPFIASDLMGIVGGLVSTLPAGLPTTSALQTLLSSKLEEMYRETHNDLHFPGDLFGPTTLAPGHGTSTEIFVDQRRVADALKAVVGALGEQAALGKFIVGAISVRFMAGTRALLGMNQWPTTCAIEIPGIREPHVPDIYRHCYAALESRQIPFACHWGQYHEMTGPRIAAAYGDHARKWREARAALLTSADARFVFGSPHLDSLGLGSEDATGTMSTTNHGVAAMIEFEQASVPYRFPVFTGNVRDTARAMAGVPARETLFLAATLDGDRAAELSTNAHQMIELAVTGQRALADLIEAAGRPQKWQSVLTAPLLARVEGFYGRHGDAWITERVAKTLAYATAIGTYVCNGWHPARFGEVATTPKPPEPWYVVRARLGLDKSPIAVASDVDPPAAPINAGSTPYWQRMSQPFEVHPADGSEARKRTVRVRYIEEGDRKNPVLLLLHGHGSRLEEVDDLVAALVDSFCVVVPDLPSMGGYSSYEGSACGLPQVSGSSGLDFYLDFLPCFLSAIGLGDKKVFLGGGSLGGNLSLLATTAARIPGLAGVAAWSPGSVWPLDVRDIHHVAACGFDLATLSAGFPVLEHRVKNPQDRNTFFGEITAKIAFYAAQPEHWYWSGWNPQPKVPNDLNGQPVRPRYLADSVDCRHDVFSPLMQTGHWQIALEQLKLSHWACADPHTPRYATYVKHPVLLMWGVEDNLGPEHLGPCTAALAAQMQPIFSARNVPFRATPFANTGHSIHNERPLALAREIKSFFGVL